MKLGILEKYDKPFEYAGVVMHLVIAYQFYMLWVRPGISDVFKIADFATLMAFEFIMVHSGVFMAVMPKKVSLYVLIPVYSLFALAMNASVSDNSILIIYCLVVFNRMRFAFSDVSLAIRTRAILTSIFSVLIYFVLIFIVAFGKDFVPAFGLNTKFLNSINYFENLSSGGLFLEEPKTAIALGFLYYIILAFVEVLLVNKDFSKFSVGQIKIN